MECSIRRSPHLAVGSNRMQSGIASHTKSNQQAIGSGPSRAVVLVNLTANNSAAEPKWRRIRTEVLGALPTNTEVCAYRPPFDLVACIRELHEKEHISCFISAGGDGTLNHVLNAILQVFKDHPQRPYLGAIGLGSGNDYHKPFQKTCLGIPLRIDMATSVFSDVGQVQYTTEAGEFLRYFITGASIGMKAEANRLFNLGDPVIKALKHRFVDLTTLYTAIRTLLTYQNVEVAIQHDASHQVTELTNLSLFTTSHVSGIAEYDLPTRRDDGYLEFHLCCAKTRFDRLKLLHDLAHKRFDGRPGRVSMLVRTASLKAPTPIPLATDGDIQLAHSAIFSVVQNRIAFLS
jgi:diacylglycerol kinase (ATP)